MSTAEKGRWWRTVKTGPASEVLRGVESLGVRWVFVGGDSGNPAIYTSENADFEAIPATVTDRNPTGGNGLYGVAYGATEGKVIAVGDNGQLEVSSDVGLTWAPFGLGAGDLRAIVNLSGDANANFVAVGDGVIRRRDNATVWSLAWSGSQLWNSVTHKAGVGFVACGNDGYIIQSNDGVTWGTPYALTASALRGIASNATWIVAVGADGSVFRSQTGLAGSWTAHPIDGAPNLRDVETVTTANQWTACALDGRVYFSGSEAQSWTALDYQIDDTAVGVRIGATRGGLVGDNGGVYVTYEQAQQDIAESPGAPTVPAAYSANADMAGDAVNRLVTQLRSGRG